MNKPIQIIPSEIMKINLGKIINQEIKDGEEKIIRERQELIEKKHSGEPYDEKRLDYLNSVVKYLGIDR